MKILGPSPPRNSLHRPSVEAAGGQTCPQMPLELQHLSPCEEERDLGTSWVTAVYNANVIGLHGL